MSDILVITAANKKFEDLVHMCAKSSKDLGYNTLIYDLGGLETGIPFDGRVFDQIGGKIPSKPNIILDALYRVNDKDYVVWLDADTIMWNNIEDIRANYDIGVTVRNPKHTENDLPINAGVVFIRKTDASIKFVEEWASICENEESDQVVLNRLCKVTSAHIGTCIKKNNTSIKIFPCDTHNNFYFKKPQLHAKIIHYKSKHRSWWPNRTVKKIPKGASDIIKDTNTESRFSTPK